jgi:hypothetical protein
LVKWEIWQNGETARLRRRRVRDRFSRSTVLIIESRAEYSSEGAIFSPQRRGEREKDEAAGMVGFSARSL